MTKIPLKKIKDSWKFFFFFTIFLSFLSKQTESCSIRQPPTTNSTFNQSQNYKQRTMLLDWILIKKEKKKKNLSSQTSEKKTQSQNAQIIFGNCFFPLFFIFKNNFLFFRLKNLFGNSKQAENKNCFQNSICEGN